MLTAAGYTKRQWLHKHEVDMDRLANSAALSSSVDLLNLVLISCSVGVT